MNIINNLIKKIRQLCFAIRYKRAVRKANSMAELFKMKYYVIYIGGKLKVVPKQTLKQLIARKRFRKGTTIEMIEKRALYITK